MRPLLVAATAALLLFACRDSAWSQAARRDTAPAWRAFLSAHPDDERAQDARERLAELELEGARRVHSVLAYKRFLAEFSDTESAPAAVKLLEGLRFNAAMEQGTALALRQFLREHPDGAHRGEAEARLQALELQQLLASDDPETLAALAQSHPDDPRFEAARLEADDIAYARAASPRAWLDYLRDYPAGQHRDEARTRLLSVELEGLLVSGDAAGARALVARSPLARGIADLHPRLERAQAVLALEASRDDLVRRALPSYTLRPFDEVVRALSAPDPMDRWQAAEELGFFASVHAIDPLLEAFRTGRLPIIRQRALVSLGRVLRALPREVAEHEVARRLDTLAPNASDAQLQLTIAALLDLSGQLGRAASEYRRAWDANQPDPVVLDRWADIRVERRQFFSAAVAARQMAVWADGVMAARGAVGPAEALWASREACNVLEVSRRAEGIIEAAAAEKTEFPDDVQAFLVKARATRRLAEARLRDAELQLLAVDADARRCGDDAVAERMAAGREARIAALRQLAKRPPRDFALLLDIARNRDPEPSVREAAKGLR